MYGVEQHPTRIGAFSLGRRQRSRRMNDCQIQQAEHDNALNIKYAELITFLQYVY